MEMAHGLFLEADAMDTMDKQKYIFGNIFLILQPALFSDHDICGIVKDAQQIVPGI